MELCKRYVRVCVCVLLSACVCEGEECKERKVKNKTKERKKYMEVQSVSQI